MMQAPKFETIESEGMVPRPASGKGGSSHRRPSNPASFALLFALAFALVPLAGCMHYAKGPGSNLEFARIYVAPVKNDSSAFQAQALLTKQIRRKLSNQQNLKIAKSPEDAAVLEVTIVDLSQSVAATGRNDTTRAMSFDLTMEACCTLWDGPTGEVYFENHRVSASVECAAFEYYHEVKYQVMPQLTEKLADKICEAVCDHW